MGQKTDLLDPCALKKQIQKMDFLFTTRHLKLIHLGVTAVPSTRGGDNIKMC